MALSTARLPPGGWAGTGRGGLGGCAIALLLVPSSRCCIARNEPDAQPRRRNGVRGKAKPSAAVKMRRRTARRTLACARRQKVCTCFVTSRALIAACFEAPLRCGRRCLRSAVTYTHSHTETRCTRALGIARGFHLPPRHVPSSRNKNHLLCGLLAKAAVSFESCKRRQASRNLPQGDSSDHSYTRQPSKVLVNNRPRKTKTATPPRGRRPGLAYWWRPQWCCRRAGAQKGVRG